MHTIAGFFNTSMSQKIYNKILVYSHKQLNIYRYDKNFVMMKQPTSFPNKHIVFLPCIEDNNFTLFPSLDEKLWKMRWGNCSDMVPTSGISCRITTLDRVKYAVGPNGRWHTMRPSAERKQGSFQYSVLFIKWKIISDRYNLINI